MFQSGFTANAGTVAAILDKQDVIVSDRLNHASIIDGARLSRAEIKVFEHKDADHADALLGESKAEGRRQLLVTDGVFSMDGDIAPLRARGGGRAPRGDHDGRRCARVGRARNGGAGTVDHFGLHGRVDVQVGTLSKAIGVLGGYIAGPHELIEWLQNRGRPYLFSTSAPPAAVAACIEALDIIEDEPERLERLWSNTRSFKAGLHELRFDTGASETPITPVITGTRSGRRSSRGGCSRRVFCPRHRVPHGREGLGPRADDRDGRPHEGDLGEALETFGRVGAELGLRGAERGTRRPWIPRIMRSSPKSNCWSVVQSAK